MAEAKEKKGGAAYIFISFIVAIALICVAWYFLINKNVAGLGETLRPMIKDIPVISMALPPPLDPSDPSLYPREQLDEEYRKIYAERNALTTENETLKTENAELNKIKSQYTILERELNTLTAQLQTNEQNSDDGMITFVDEEAMKNYVKIYETMDSGEAATILENMGTLNIDLVIKICKNMKSNKLSAIMIEMDDEFASVLAERLAVEMNVI